MAMYCCCHCFLYPRTECIMMYNVVRGCAEILPERLQCGCLVGQQGRLEISDTLPPTTANQCKDNFPMPSISALLPLFFFFFCFCAFFFRCEFNATVVVDEETFDFERQLFIFGPKIYCAAHTFLMILLTHKIY